MERLTDIYADGEAVHEPLRVGDRIYCDRHGECIIARTDMRTACVIALRDGNRLSSGPQPIRDSDRISLEEFKAIAPVSWCESSRSGIPVSEIYAPAKPNPRPLAVGDWVKGDMYLWQIRNVSLRCNRQIVLSCIEDGSTLDKVLIVANEKALTRCDAEALFGVLGSYSRITPAEVAAELQKMEAR